MASHFAVWGNGPARHTLVRDGEITDRAFEIAQDNGFVVTGHNSYAVEVWCEEEDIDKATRFDDGVEAWTPIV